MGRLERGREQQPRELLETPLRHGLPVLNAEHPIEEVSALLALSRSAHVKAKLLRKAHIISDQLLNGFTVIPIARIEATKKGIEEGVAIPFVGDYIGEEFHGLPHPLLIVPKDKVEKHKK